MIDSHVTNERSARKRQTRDEHVTVEHKAGKAVLTEVSSLVQLDNNISFICYKDI